MLQIFEEAERLQLFFLQLMPDKEFFRMWPKLRTAKEEKYNLEFLNSKLFIVQIGHSIQNW
jgi:hypothetical protein